MVTAVLTQYDFKQMIHSFTMLLNHTNAKLGLALNLHFANGN